MASSLQRGRFGEQGDTLQGFRGQSRYAAGVNDGRRPQRLNRDASAVGRNFTEDAAKAFQAPEDEDNFRRRTRPEGSGSPLEQESIYDRVTQTRSQWRDRALRKGLQGGLGDTDVARWKGGPRGEADRAPAGLFPGDRDVTRQVGGQSAAVFGGTNSSGGAQPTPSQAEAAERARVASEQAAQEAERQRQQQAQEAERQRQQQAEAERQRQQQEQQGQQGQQDDRERRLREQIERGEAPSWATDPDQAWVNDPENGWGYRP